MVIDGQIAKGRFQWVASGDSGTIGSHVEPFPELTATQTAAAELTESIGLGRSRAPLLTEQYVDLHKRSFFVEWDVKQPRVASRRRPNC